MSEILISPKQNLKKKEKYDFLFNAHVFGLVSGLLCGFSDVVMVLLLKLANRLAVLKTDKQRHV